MISQATIAWEAAEYRRAHVALLAGRPDEVRAIIARLRDPETDVKRMGWRVRGSRQKVAA